MNCRKRRESDEIRCHTCGLYWDAGEDEPPCPQTLEAGIESPPMSLDDIKRMVDLS